METWNVWLPLLWAATKIGCALVLTGCAVRITWAAVPMMRMVRVFADNAASAANGASSVFALLRDAMRAMGNNRDAALPVRVRVIGGEK